MASEIKYCLRCGREVMTGLLSGNAVHVPVHPGVEEGYCYCHGPFTEVPPPPALTEEDWKSIFEQEVIRG